ncbi:MAG: hypothetical protein KF864_07955 [Phycisphaeraceae bacterium]|nr:hypothetical protein [Phycisphaeraceae bacterium]
MPRRPRTPALLGALFAAILFAAGCTSQWERAFVPATPDRHPPTPTVTLHPLTKSELGAHRDPPDMLRLGDSRFLADVQQHPKISDLIRFARRIGATDVYWTSYFSHRQNQWETIRTPREVQTRSTGTIRDEKGREQRVTLTNTTTYYDTREVERTYIYYVYLATFYRAQSADPAVTP